MRKFLLIVRMYIQAFTRRKVWMSFLCFGVIFTLGCYLYVYDHEYILAMLETCYGQIILTLVFMMMGIELIREQRREHLNDIMAAYSKRPGFIPWAQVLAIGFIDLLMTLVIMAVCYIRMILDNAPALWIEQSLAYIALLYFLPCLILGIWGLLISQWNKGKSVYLPAILVWVLTSSLFSTYLVDYIRSITQNSGGLFLNALNMGMNNFHIFDNVSTGAPIELPRWIVRIGIAVLLIALFQCNNSRSFASTRKQKRNAGIMTASVAVYGIAMMTFFYHNYSVFFTRFADPMDRIAYVWSKHVDYIPGKSVSLGDFPSEKNITLVKTDIDLSCTTQGIKAEVIIEAVMDADADGQSFMLYSDLNVDDVRVDGKTTEFERSNDGLMVHFPNAKKAGDKVTFVFRYHGYSLPCFPANETTVQLNRSFPWIPWPGIKTATKYGNYYKYDESEEFFIEDWQRGDKVQYTLRYKGPGNSYTNLEKQGDNIYIGSSHNGISLYSGMVHYNHRDVDIYLPAGLYQDAIDAVDGLLDAYDPLLELCERMETLIKPVKPQFITVMKMRCPGISSFVSPQELYSRDDEWELRLKNDSINIADYMRNYADSLEAYQASKEIRVRLAVSYLMNPCVGYPIDVSHPSTSNFAAWLSFYILAPVLDDSDFKYYSDMLREQNSGNGRETINGAFVDEIPLTKEEEGWISGILDRMRSKENFDETFKALYHRLLNKEAITASDIVSALYHHQGE
ncbi:MAG: hypothetical protein VB118_01205 [Oscillospiraceae bacterium]|nr:hypothetical protein [Oscillospiraceae bacterium]